MKIKKVKKIFLFSLFFSLVIFILPVVLAAPPNVTLVSPNNTTTSYTENITFTCNATDDFMLSNISLYVWNSTAKYYTNTTNVSGVFNKTNWTIIRMPDDSYKWNCLAYDNESQSAFANSNFTLSVNAIDNAPNVNLISPNDTQKFLTTNSVTFNCLVSDDFALNNISLWHDIGGAFSRNKTREFGKEVQGEYEQGIVLLLHFNNNSAYGENSTFAYDFSGNGNNGAVIGVDYNSTGGKFGGAFEFYKAYDSEYPESESIKIQDSDSLDLTTNGTIETWIKIRTALSSGYYIVFTKGDSYDEYSPYVLWVYFFNGQARLQLYLGNGVNIQLPVPQTDTINIGEWYHFAATWDNNIIKLYLNGVLNKSVTQIVTPFNSSRVLRIGKNTMQGTTFNGTIDEIAIYNRTLTIEEIEIHSGKKPSNISQTLKIDNIPDGSYKWTCKVTDNSSQSVFAATNYTFLVNVNAPIFVNITISPSSEDDIDPGVTINVTANITEPFVDTVILQYKQATLAAWTNKTMTNTSLGIYEANFTASPGGTWDYRIWANDTNSHSNFSTTANITAELDYTWTRSPVNFSTVSGILNTNKSIGILMINNTGDFGLNFDLSSDWQNTFYNETEPFDLAAKAVKYINTTIIFGSYAREDDVVITIDATSANAEPSILYTNVTLVSYTGGAYLYNTLINYATGVNQSNSINLYGSVKNIGNETALNTLLSWIVPSSSWNNVSGNLTQQAVNLTADSTIYNNVTINVSSSVSPGAYTIYLNSTCNNIVGTCSDLESFTIYVYCSSTDGVCGSGCSYETSSANYDSDCRAPPPTIIGGGGGGAAVSKEEAVVYSKTIEIVRGKEDSFDIEVYNKYFNSSLEDLTLNITGFLSQYITISPNKIDKINSKETKKFNVKLKIPSYKESYEEHTLKAIIKGKLIIGNSPKEYTETQNIKLIIQEISADESKLGLSKAEEAILEMKNAGFNIQEVSKLLEQAKSKLSEKRNKEAQVLSKRIKDIRDKAFSANYLIEKISEALKNPRKTNLLTGNIAKEIIDENGDKVSVNLVLTGKVIFSGDSAENVLNMAIAAFKRGDFTTAEERAKSAQVLLLLERKGNFGLFLYLYWYFILMGFLIFSFAGIFSYKTYQKYSITRRIQDIDKEEDNIRELLSSSQKNYFSGKISVVEYHRIMNQHQNKLAKIKSERLRLRSRRIKVLKQQQILQDLRVERLHVESEIKKLQEQFYKDKRISENEYDTEFKILNKRLTEIEGEKITLELLKQKKDGETRTRDSKSELKKAVIKSEKEKISVIKNKFSSSINKIKEKNKKVLTIFKNLFKLLKKIIRKIRGVDKNGVMLIDNKIIGILKEEASKTDCKGKWIKLNFKSKDERKNEN